MGRELRRKQAKKEGKSLKTNNNIEPPKVEFKKYMIIIGSLLLVFVFIYLISGLFITKEIKWFNKNKENHVENTSSTSILASAIFKQSEEEYYVYFYDFNKPEKSIENVVNTKLNGQKVYRVDTSSALNSNYVSESSNKSAKTLEELKVISNTVIKISNKTIVEYYEGREIEENL